MPLARLGIDCPDKSSTFSLPRPVKTSAWMLERLLRRMFSVCNCVMLPNVRAPKVVRSCSEISKNKSFVGPRRNASSMSVSLLLRRLSHSNCDNGCKTYAPKPESDWSEISMYFKLCKPCAIDSFSAASWLPCRYSADKLVKPANWLGPSDVRFW